MESPNAIHAQKEKGTEAKPTVVGVDPKKAPTEETGAGEEIHQENDEAIDSSHLPRILQEEEQVRYEYLTFETGLPWPTTTSTSRPLLPSDPLTWPPKRKAFVTWLSCLSTLVTTYTPGAYAAGVDQYKHEWNITTTQVYGGITTFTLCFAIAPMILAPFSEIQGRRPVFLAAGAAYVVSQIGSAVTRSFAGMLVTRAIAGVSCSVFSTMVGGVISDIYASKHRNTPMVIFSGAALAGCGIGPMVSGIVAQHLNWRWIFYLQTMSCGVVVTALFISFPETRGSVLLSRRAKILNSWYESYERGSKPVENPAETFHKLRWKVMADEERATLGVLIKTSLTRPLFLLLTESVVFWFSIWMAFAWSILYLTFEALPLLFGKSYSFNNQQSGLVFGAVTVASIIAAVVAVLQERLPFPRDRPESRLYVACVQSILLPVGLFWLCATTNPSVPWIVPVLAVGCLTLGIFSVYLAVFNYLADTYSIYASSAIAAQSFTRNVFAACLPLATEPMFLRLGFKKAGYLLGSIGLGLGLVPWVLVMWGDKIRRRSKLAMHLAD